jgi:hypothetical protein
MDLHKDEFDYKQIRKMKFPKSIKLLRHTSKSHILDSEKFPHFVRLLSGQKPVGDNERFYWTTSKLRAAFNYLRKCYGFGATPRLL